MRTKDSGPPFTQGMKSWRKAGEPVVPEQVREDVRRLPVSATRAARSKVSLAPSRDKSQMEGEVLGALIFCASAVRLF